MQKTTRCLLALALGWVLTACLGCDGPQPSMVSDAETLMGEALDAVASHDLGVAEQKAYNAAILSADSTEMTDALTLLSLVYMLEEKQHQAEMVMAVLPEGQAMAFVQLQHRAAQKAQHRERAIFAGFIVFLFLASAGYFWQSRRRAAAFEARADELLGMLEQRNTAEAPQPATLRSDMARTKMGVDVLYAILHDDNISQMGKREQAAVSETIRIVEPRLAKIIDSIGQSLTPKETFFCIMEYYGKTDPQKAQSFCCSDQALRSTKSRLGKKLALDILREKDPKHN